MDGGKLLAALGGGALWGALAEVTATAGGGLEALESKPTDEEAMSSSLEVAASSLCLGVGRSQKRGRGWMNGGNRSPPAST